MVQKITYSLLFFTLGFVIPAYSIHSIDTVKTINGSKEEWVIKDNSGIIKEIIRLKNGLKDGIQEVFYQNGKKSIETNYLNGNLSGLKITFDLSGDIKSRITYKYYPDKKRSMPNGNFETYSSKILIAKGTYKDSLIDGNYEEYHANGNLKRKCTYKNGLLTGQATEYRISGELYSESNYSIITENGKFISALNGSVRYYQQIGKLTEEGFYLNNKKDGVFKSYNEGELYKSVTWKNNLQHGEVIEYTKGKLKKKYNYYQEFDNDGVILKNILDGRVEEYYDNGKLSKIENYKKGKKHGFFEEYFDSGNYKSKSEYQNGLQTGKYEMWDAKGNKTFESSFKIIFEGGIEKSVKHGNEKRWENGKLNYEQQYDNGMDIGESKSFFPNGKLMKVASVSNGRYNGRCLEYYENGQLKSDQTFKTFTDKSGSLKSIQLGWRIEYDKEGKYLNRYYHDTLGEISIYMNYYNGKPMNITYKDLLSMSFFPDGKLMSFEILGGNYSGSFGLYFYWNGQARKMKVLNANLDVLNYINFSDKGEPLFSYTDMHQNPIDKRMDEKDIKKYAKTINKELITNALFSDSVKNGVYKLYYAGGKLMGELNFTNDFPNGKFLFYDPIGTDTLSYSEYEKGKKTGYFVQKFGGKTLLKRGRYFKNGQLAWNENYHTNGLPTSKSSFDETGKRIENTEYFENGKVKYYSNEITGEYASYDLKNDLQFEVKFIDISKKIKRHVEYYPSTSQLKSVYYTTNGVKDSIWENYFKDGQLQFRYKYKNGKKNGASETYNEKGELTVKGNFIDDKQDGIFEIRTNGKLETVYYENGNLKVLPSNVACACQDTKESMSTTTFAPPVNQLISYKRLKMFLPDNMIPEDSISFSKIFYTGFQNSSGRDGAFFSMNLMMFQPHYFKIPSDEQIKITLNPCHTKGYRSRMELTTDISYSNDNETSIRFYPERISLEFPKSPIKDVTDKSMDFRAYFDTKEVSIEREKKLKMELEADSKSCHSPGIIFNFLRVNISESEPLLFKNPKEVAGLSTSNLTLSDSELKSFFGLWVKKAEISFPMKIDSKEYSITAESNLMLAGGTYVAGEIQIPCSADGQDISVKIEKEKIKFTIEEVKTLWLDKGFTKLSVSLNNDKSKLIIKFYAD